MPGMPASGPAAFCISSAWRASSWRLASAWAAAPRSPTISPSPGAIRLSSMSTRRIWPVPFSVTFTRPSPAWPSSTSCSSSAWAVASLSCMAWACFIREDRSFTSILLVFGLSGLRRLRLRQGADADDLGAREALHHRLHEGVLLDLGPHLALLALLALPQALGPAAALRGDQPALAGPVLQPPYQALRQIGGRAGGGLVLDGAGPEADRPHEPLHVELQRDVPLLLDQ